MCITRVLKPAKPLEIQYIKRKNTTPKESKKP